MGLPLAARSGKLRDEREAFLWESQLREKQGIGNVWVAKTNHGSKGSGVRVLDGGCETCDFIDDALQGSSLAVAVQKYVEDPLLILGYKFDIRVWVLVDMQLGVFLYREVSEGCGCCGAVAGCACGCCMHLLPRTAQPYVTQETAGDARTSRSSQLLSRGHGVA